MVSLGEALVGWLRADGGIVALVGNRIYDLVAPQESKRPYLSYQVLGADDGYTADGPDGNNTYRVQVAVEADGAADAAKLEKLVRNRLAGSRADWPSATPGGGSLPVAACMLTDRFQQEVPGDRGSEVRRRRWVLEFEVETQEA